MSAVSLKVVAYVSSGKQGSATKWNVFLLPNYFIKNSHYER